MADHKAAATNFLNALDRIPKLIEQNQAENAKLEKDLPTLREIVSGSWKKEDELKTLKSEVATLERKIQLTLAPQEQSKQENADLKKENDTTIDKGFIKNHIIVTRAKTVVPKISTG